MIIEVSGKKSFDTATDLNAEERHVLQKLMLWEGMVSSLQQFREKKDEALFKGWNGSGPIREGPALAGIILHLEEKIRRRLEKSG